MSIRNKLILVLLLFSVIPVTTLVVFETKRGQKTLERQIGISSLEFTRLAMKRVNEYLYFKLKDVQSWKNQVSQEYLSTSDADSNISSYFKGLLESYDEYYYITCLNNKGQVVASSDVKLMGMDLWADPEINNALSGNLIIKDVSFNRMAGGYAVVISAPIMDTHTQAKTVGVVSAALKWNNVSGMIADLEIRGKKQDIANHFMLTNKDGLVISCFDNSKMFTTNLISMEIKSARYAQEHKEGSLVETSEHALSSFSTYTYMKDYKNLPPLNWLLILYQDSECIFAPVYSLKTTMLSVLVVTILSMAVISLFFGNRISKPILTLASIAQTIGKGDLTKEIKVKSKDEIGFLSDSFDKMRTELGKSFENVERHRKGLQRLSKKIVSVQEEVLKNISCELHDQTGQALVALKTNLEVVGKLLPRDSVKVHQWLNESKQLLRQTIKEVRNLSFYLRPTMLDELGLVPTIESYAKDFSARTMITVDVKSNLKSKRFNQDIELSFYRMVQEALTNIVKHSEAKNVQINVYHKNSELELNIKDDGKGFEIIKMFEEGINEHSVGLLGMKERFKSIDADFKIFSTPGEGTELIAKCQIKS